jgi:hypothetical protein
MTGRGYDDENKTICKKKVSFLIGLIAEAKKKCILNNVYFL